MTLTDEQRRDYWRKKDLFNQHEKMLKSHTCADCGNPLILPWDPERQENVLVCGTDRTHKGFVRDRTWAERWRAGEPVPMPIADRLEQRYGRRPMDSNALAVMPIDKMLARIEGARFPQELKPPEKRMLAELAITYALDPAMGELTIYQGHPYVSIDGRYRKAQETGHLAGVETRPATKQERKEWEIPDADFFFRSEVYVKGVERPFVGWGRVRQVETKPHPDPRKRGFRPLETNPQRMAEKRAEAQALRKAFHIPLPSAELIGEEGPYPEAIEGEARELPDEEAGPQVDKETGEVQEPGPPDTTEHRSRPTPAAVTRSEEADADAGPRVPPDDLPMGTLGDLFNACKEWFGLKKPEVYDILNVHDSTDIADVRDAWATVRAHKLPPEQEPWQE